MKNFLVLLCICLMFWGCGEVEKESETAQLMSDCPNCAGIEDQKISAEVIITVYNEDGSKFLTPQEHVFCLCDDSFIVKTKLNENETLMRLTKNGVLSMPKGSEIINKSPLSVLNAEIFDIIRQLVFANESVVAVSQKPENVYGQWYVAAKKGGSNYLYYVSVSSKLAELLISNNYIARGYDYFDPPAFDYLVPGKIEILKVGTNGSPGDKILKLDYKKFK